LHFNITEEDLQLVFAPYGEIEFVNLHFDAETGRSKGYAFVQFKRAEDAKKALGQVNGLEIAGRQIKVGLVNENNKQDIAAMANMPVHGDLDDDEGGGFSLNAQSRAMLMAKLQRPTSQTQSTPVSLPGPSSPTALSPPTTCILLKNMFDPASESEPNWEVDIKEDVRDECSKFGTVAHIHVEKDSPGFVYMKFGSIPSAQNAIDALDKRYFAGRMIEADFMNETIYKNRFPEAFSKL